MSVRRRRSGDCRIVAITVALLASSACMLLGHAQEDAAPVTSVEEFIFALRPSRGVSVQPTQLFVNFEFGSAELTQESRAVLDALGAALSSNELAGYRYELAGHTDSVGSEEYNRQLSLARARAVQTYLRREHSVPDERITVAGYGSQRPKTPENPKADANRRVEISYAGRAP